MSYAYRRLLSKGLDAVCFKTEGESGGCSRIEDAVGGRTLLLPVPAVRDGAVTGPHAIPFADVVGAAERGTIYGGGFSPRDIYTASDHGIRLKDLLSDERLAAKNAALTAEGAIFEAMKRSRASVWGSSALVIGFGRIGKLLAHMLSALGADTSVCLRNEKDAALLDARRVKTISFDRLEREMCGFDFIFNTVPQKVASSAAVDNAKKDALVFDLASPPGGFGPDRADRVIYLPGVPGKYAPKTAGELIADAFIAAVKEDGRERS
jgi:dipicolinate synthase subunit A